MGPYSHIVIAHELETFIKPDNTQEYYWGAVAPDVRYVVDGMTKKHTHLSAEEIKTYMHKYPLLMDFLNGYMVHCLSDKLSLRTIIQQKFPFSLIKNRITKNNCTIILEFLNIELIKTTKKFLPGKNNPVLRELGVSDWSATKYSQNINRYINSPSYTSSITLYQNLGFKVGRRVEKYHSVVQSWQHSWIKKNLVLIRPQLRKMNREIAASIKTQISNVLLEKEKSVKYHKVVI